MNGLILTRTEDLPRTHGDTEARLRDHIVRSGDDDEREIKTTEVSSGFLFLPANRLATASVFERAFVSPCLRGSGIFVRNSRVFLLLLLLAWTTSASATLLPPTTAPAAGFSHTWLLQLPGIGGEMQIDRNLIRGLKAGGWDGPITIYDWTENDPGMAALLSRKRNDQEAQKVADMIQAKLKDDPQLQITITSHSGGTGIAVWALEKLPADMKVQTLMLLSSALSPEYDLSAALKHVRGKAYAFYSENDTLILGRGTKAFGTIDGVKTAAAGLEGFTEPPDGDDDQYAKLTQRPWIKEWMALDNAGSHIGFMSRPFAETVLAPLLIEGLSRESGRHPTASATTTQPIRNSAKGVQ